MTVTDAIDHASPARSPETNGAIKYLVASGATAISIVEIDGVCTFRIGTTIDPNAVEIYWLAAVQAKPLARLARKEAGRHPDIATASAALARAAAGLRATLTPHHVAIERAGEAAAKLNRYMDGLHGTGVLKEFTKAYRRRRLAAAERGEGFMSFGNAEARLRKALIPLLVGGQNVGPVQSLFAELFGPSS
jgi:hypothetical protein